MPAYDPYQGVSPLPWVQVTQTPVQLPRISNIRPAPPEVKWNPALSRTNALPPMQNPFGYDFEYLAALPYVPPDAYAMMTPEGYEMWTMPNYFE